MSNQSDLFRSKRKAREQFNDQVADVYAALQKNQRVFYVGSVDGNSAFSGRRVTSQVATVDQGVNLLTTNRGDVLLVSPFHVEDLATAGAIALDVADVQVLGLNFGGQRPSLTASATGSTITMTSANVVFKSFNLTCNIASQTTFIDMSLDADGCVLDDLHLLEGTATGLNFITLTSANDVVIKNIFCRATTAGNYNEVLLIAGTPNNLLLEDWNVRGDFDEACIQNAVGNIATNMTLRRMVLRNTLTGQHAIQLASACTGFAEDILCVTDTHSISFDAGALELGKNIKWQSTTGGDVGVSDVFVTPDSTSSILGVNDADNLFDSSNVVANVDGSVLERLEDIVVKVTAVDDIIDSEFAVVATAVGAVADAALADTIEGAAAATQSLLTDVKGVLQRLGADNANNTSATTLVVANRDGSILERLEQLEATVQKTIAKVQTTPSGGADALFTITGGPIHVVSIWGVVTTVLVGAANGTLQATTTDPAATTAMSTTVAIDNDAKGTVYTFVGPSGVLTPTTLGLTLIDMGSTTLTETQYIVPIGNINFLTSGALTGAITWYMSYIPSPGAVVA